MVSSLPGAICQICLLNPNSIACERSDCLGAFAVTPLFNLRDEDDGRQLTFDVITKAEHYNMHPSGVECIDVIESMPFNIGTAVKYIWRFEHKNGLEDLRKSVYYCSRELFNGEFTRQSEPPDGKRFEYHAKIAQYFNARIALAFMALFDAAYNSKRIKRQCLHDAIFFIEREIAARSKI